MLNPVSVFLNVQNWGPGKFHIRIQRIDHKRLRLRGLARQALRAAAPLGVGAFWCCLWIAAERYPSEYDWRYMTISSLLYPERNPHGYRWAWGGVAVCGLGGLCWVSGLIWNGRPSSGAGRPVGIWVIGLGYICMVCCALLPTPFLHMPRSHDILALCAFVGLCIGTVQLTYRSVERGLRGRSRNVHGRSWIYACAIAGAALLPLLLVSITQAYVSHAYPQLPWVGLEWRERGIPAYLSFAFWEWITCVVLSGYTSALAFVAS
jgi:hypothetical protein